MSRRSPPLPSSDGGVRERDPIDRPFLLPLPDGRLREEGAGLPAGNSLPRHDGREVGPLTAYRHGTASAPAEGDYFIVSHLRAPQEDGIFPGSNGPNSTGARDLSFLLSCGPVCAMPTMVTPMRGSTGIAPNGVSIAGRTPAPVR